MRTSERTPGRSRDFRYTRHLLGRGAVWGMLAAVVSTVLWIVVTLVINWVDAPDTLSARGVGLTVAFGVPIALILGAIGGLLAAAMLRLLMCFARVTTVLGVLSGSLVGMAFGFLFLLITMTLSPEGGCDSTLCWIGVLLLYVGIPTFAGAWHGWQMTRWLQKREV